MKRPQSHSCLRWQMGLWWRMGWGMGWGTGLWWRIAASSAHRWVTYRVTIVASIVSNVIITVLRVYLVIAVWEVQPGLAGYDPTEAVTFSVVSQALVVTFAVFGGMIDIPWHIQNGRIVCDLVRPVGLLSWWLAYDAGRAWVYLVTRALPSFMIAAVLFDVAAPGSPSIAVAFAASMLLAFVVSFCIRYLAALTAFWVTDARGVLAVSGVVAVFCSGAVLPLTIFPDGVSALARLLPYAATVQVPSDIYLGRDDTLAALGFQAFWALTLLTVAAATTRRAVRRVVVQGG